MGGCLATIFKAGQNRHTYRPIRTGTTAKYGTNSQGRGYGSNSKGSNRNKSNNTSSSSSASGSPSTLTCPACGFSTNYKREMHQHIQSRHGGKVKRPKAPKDPALEYTPGGNQGEQAATSQWSDLHKSESELAAEIILREHQRGRYGPVGDTRPPKPSRFERAKKGAGSIFGAARSAIKTHGPTRGTKGVDNSRKKKKKRKKRAKE